MKNDTRIHYPPLFSSADYYTKRDLQFPVSADCKMFSAQTVLKRNSGITLVYFHDDNGCILVNAKEYPAGRGTLICLGAYHYFQISPQKGSMKVTLCRLSYDAFLYMAANPYYRFDELTLAMDPLTSHLEGQMLERAEHVIDDLVATSTHHDHKGGMTEFLLSMRLMGILQKTFIRAPKE